MRRIAGCILIATVALTGCKSTQRAAEPLQSVEGDYGLQPDLYVSNTSTTAPAEVAAPVETTYQPYAAQPEPLALTASVSRTHTVSKGDTLFGLARRYYSNAARWRDIYEANRDVLPDPDKLYVGRELVIP